MRIRKLKGVVFLERDKHLQKNGIGSMVDARGTRSITYGYPILAFSASTKGRVSLTQVFIHIESKISRKNYQLLINDD